MAGGPWMPIYWGDYIRDTTHLTLEEHGAYLLLIAAYWRHGGPLPADDQYLCRVTRAGKRWGHIKKAVLPFFILEPVSDAQKRSSDNRLARTTDNSVIGHQIRHKRIDLELLRSSGRTAAGVRANSVRWSGRTPNHNHNHKEKKAEQQEAAPRSDFSKIEAMANKALELVGTDAAKSPIWALTADLQRWLHAGADFEGDVLPAIAECMAKRKAKGEGPPSGWRYFENAVADARRRRLDGLPMRNSNGSGGGQRGGMIAAAEARLPFKAIPDPSAHLSPKERSEMADRVKARVMASLKRAP